MKSSMISTLRDSEMDGYHPKARAAGTVTNWQIAMKWNLHVAGCDWGKHWMGTRGAGPPVSHQRRCKLGATRPRTFIAIATVRPFCGIDTLHRAHWHPLIHPFASRISCSSFGAAAFALCSTVAFGTTLFRSCCREELWSNFASLAA